MRFIPSYMCDIILIKTTDLWHQTDVCCTDVSIPVTSAHPNDQAAFAETLNCAFFNLLKLGR